MLGTLLNGSAILLGGAIGLTVGRDLSPTNQHRLKAALALLTVYVGFTMTWRHINGSFLEVIRQAIIVLLALILGNLIGKSLRLQSRLNQVGQYARDRFEKSGSDSVRISEGFITCTLLFCVGPMALLGSLEDGLTGKFRILAIKSAMDGLASMAFAKTFGWGVLLSAIPVLAFQGSLTLGARFLESVLKDPALMDSINATGGLLVLTLSLLILGVRKVPVADYLPSLIVAPALAWLWK